MGNPPKDFLISSIWFWKYFSIASYEIYNESDEVLIASSLNKVMCLLNFDSLGL